MQKRRVATAFAVTILLTPLFSHAQTAVDLQIQINSLLAQIATIKAQLRTSISQTVGNCPNLSRSLSRGSKGADVTALQQFLITKNFLAPASATGFFGALTEAAVRQWQAKNKIVSSGTAVTTGYGVVGARTRAALAASCVVRPSPSPTPVQSPKPTPTPTPNPTPNLIPTLLPSSPSPPSPPSHSPADGFTFSPMSGATPLAVTFTGTINASSSCASSAYTFSFGDNTARQIDVFAGACKPQTFSFTHTFVKAGTFNMQLLKNSLRSLQTAGVVPVSVGQSGFVSVSPGTTIPTPNPEYDIDPKTVFPSKASLLPNGITYTDTVPDTLDLAQRAGSYISGATQTIFPNLYEAPASAILTAAHLSGAGFCNEQPGPCLVNNGSPNWGKVMLALAAAREMSGYDRDDSQGTLRSQYSMMENMLSYDANADTTWIVIPSDDITPSTIAMEALAKEWEEHPTTALKNAIDQFVLMHYDNVISVQDPQGKSYSTIWNTPDPSSNSFGMYVGQYGSDMFINGKALRVLTEWFLASGNTLAYTIAQGLSEFVRNYNNNIFWQSPDPKYPQSSGSFAGHTHSYLMSILGMLNEAQARMQTNPNDSLAQAEISLANSVYGFMKRQFQPGLVGSFGEIGTVGDMARLGIKLSEMGAGDYYDEVEGWTRNQLAEGQIDDSVLPYIPDTSTGSYDTSHIGQKVKGMFFSDATHVFAIPITIGTAMFNNDGPANAMRGVYEVWNHIVDVNGSTASVNFLLNRASPYMDIKSDLPYRGRIEIDTAQSLGPVSTLQVHVPSWTDKAQVKVFVRGASGVDSIITNWTWSGAYVRISDITTNTAYTVTFPIKVYTATVYEVRDMNHFWAEGSYLWDPNEQGVTHTGTFRGSTLVDATNRPGIGISRYQRQALAALPSTDVAPPTKNVTQFIYNGTSSSIPNVPPISTNTTPVVSLTVNGSDHLTITPGSHYTLAWSSQNATSCALSWTTSDPSTGASGSSAIAPNTSGSGTSALVGSYTFICQSSAGPKSVTTAVTN